MKTVKVAKRIEPRQDVLDSTRIQLHPDLSPSKHYTPEELKRIDELVYSTDRGKPLEPVLVLEVIGLTPVRYYLIEGRDSLQAAMRTRCGSAWLRADIFTIDKSDLPFLEIEQ